MPDPLDPDGTYLHDHREDKSFERDLIPPGGRPREQARRRISVCPKCQSSHVDARYRARKTGDAIGAIAGAACGIAFFLSKREPGSVGLFAVGQCPGRS